MSIDQHALSPGEVAARLQLHPKTVRGLLTSGELHGRKIGNVWRVHPDAVDEFLRKPPARETKEADTKKTRSA